MMTQLQKFREQLGGADPQQKVMELLQNGKMSPQQFEQLKHQATSILKMFNIG
jgi:hypothetical protein